MRVVLAVLLTLISVQSIAKAVEDVRIDGLVQMPSARAFDLIGFNENQSYDSGKVYQAISALFDTGFFSDIDVYEENKVLIFKLVERPSIGNLTIEGNELVKTEDLERGLKLSGLEIGEIYKPETLNQIAQELQRQYYALGRYSAKVDISVEDMPRNRTGIKINIDEGDTAKIVHINIVGNNSFDEETLTKDFESRETGYWNPFSSADEYAKAKIQGDINTLKSFYLDNGYLDFQVVSSQVSLSSDKRDVYIVVNVDEGQPYFLNDVTLSGSLPIAEDRVWKQITQKKGDLFSRSQVTEIIEGISTELGDDGYLFTNVNVIPEKLDNHTVNLSYQITPGPQVYVRRITFSGNSETQDEVLRREMTQFEGALATHSKIQSSKRRIERLGFFGNVDLRTRPVAGTTDQVDIDVVVEEQASGSIQASIGYSQEDGTVLGFGISKRNFLGTGNKLSFSASRTDSTQDYSINYDNPYFTVDGVSRGFQIFYQTSDHADDDVEDYDLDEIGVGVSYGYPISDTQRLTFGMTVKESTVKLGYDPSNETANYVDTHGDNYDDVIASLTWSDNDLVGGVLPTNGYSTKATLEVALPVGDQQYAKVGLTSQKYWNLSGSDLWLFRLKGRLGYGAGYGDSDALPFFENYYAGGAYSVRGYGASSLGPQNSYDDEDTSTSALGGNILMTGTAELIFPLPMVEDHKSVRTSIFLDGGNVFTDACLSTNTDCNEGVDLDEIRFSLGFSWTWITPIAPLSFNFARPLNAQDGDSTDVFQFQLGTTF
ncbi:outer membrane protein assembly complex, YaeT protein [Marinomonas posidonica IVIA-Po-181]|uniref:Outer membrane protein assembly factor BamA n=1 Tax=Marinomonas posidonica (strain CECT 7376 / NCIMB 14433 / IVIA-Po-181) TaxID=491952 RepID=F6CY21_MARPP|nr:outer membrane protein assembly factor BamA [Marinomonas posidonica]AEF55653.1 outer membrane protein assembly complex, YaeT protein [Marinomonas posidonica IVIA-Po-181]